MKLPMLVKFTTSFLFYNSLDACKALGSTGSRFYPAHTPMLMISCTIGRSTFYFTFLTPEGNAVWLGTTLSPQELLREEYLLPVP